MWSPGDRFTGLKSPGDRFTGLKSHGDRFTGLKSPGDRFTGLQVQKGAVSDAVNVLIASVPGRHS